MINFKHFLLIIILTILPARLFSQAKIDVKINNYSDSLFYLMKYKNDKTYVVVDTTSFSYDKKTFANENKYDEGLYIIANSRQEPLFEILIGKDQDFSISIEELMDINSYKVKGSKETSGYFDVYAKTTHNKLYVKALKSEIKNNPNNIAKIDSLNKELLGYQKSKLNTRKDLFLNYYIKYTMDFVVPQEYMKDKTKSKQYLIQHYFDDLPLCDSRILNSHLLKSKLDDYFDNHIATQPSNVICDKIDDLLSRTACSIEIRDYILWYLYSKYFNSYDPKNEFVYIHLADNYFARLDIVNLTQGIRNEIIERADLLRKITVGQQAPPLSYIDENGNAVDLMDINNANTVLFFHKPDCQKCIRDKRVLGLVKKRVKNLAILSINISEDNYHNVSKDIVERFDIMTTPTIYLLDKDKKIIGKHIKAEEIEFYIINKGK